MNNTAAIKASGLSKGRESKAATKKKAKKEEFRLFQDRAAFDAALDQSLTELEQGLVYKVDMKNPQESIRKILSQVD